jgi:aldehyde:ferredoxin oxidoreductase
MKGEFGEKVACISIGQAGEMKLAAASVAITDMEQRPTRHAGRGGPGAVMGSKGRQGDRLEDDGMKMRQAGRSGKVQGRQQGFRRRSAQASGHR